MVVTSLLIILKGKNLFFCKNSGSKKISTKTYARLGLKTHRRGIKVDCGSTPANFDNFDNWMNIAKALGMGALGLLAWGGWQLFSGLAENHKVPTKQETLEILETVRIEFYPVLIKIADFVC